MISEAPKPKRKMGAWRTYIHIPECTGSDKTTGEKMQRTPFSSPRLRNEYSPEEAERELAKLAQDARRGDRRRAGKEDEDRRGPFPWPQLVEEGTKRAVWAKLRQFRGYPKGLVARSERAPTGCNTDGECFCFPLANKNGVVVGIGLTHRPPTFQHRQESAMGNKTRRGKPPRKLVLYRRDVPRATTIIVTESRWDAIAIMHYFSDQELKGVAIIGAAGLSQVVRPKYVAPGVIRRTPERQGHKGAMGV